MGEVVQLREVELTVEEAYLRGLPSPATRKAYRRCLRQFRAFLSRDLLTATRRDVEAWRADLEGAGRAPSTISRALTALSGFFEFAVDEGALDRNPAVRARRPRIPSVSPRRALSTDEVHALLEAPDLGTLLGLRDRALLALLLLQGLRVSEAVGLRLDDLDEEQGHQVATVRGKGGKVVRVPLAGPTVHAVRAWKEAAGLNEGALFVAVGRIGNPKAGGAPLHRSAAWERVRLLARRAGLAGPVYPHRLRHTAVTEALRAGVPLHSVQDFARHADPRTTRRYDSERMSLSNPTAHVLASRLGPSEPDE